MALLPVLLTAEQALRNLKLFQCNQAVDTESKSRMNVLNAPSSIGEVICRASATNLPERHSPPPSNVETFRNPKLHLDVVSTFLATAMKSTKYVPNESYGGTVDAATEFQNFANFLHKLQVFQTYMPLVETVSQKITHGPKDDCKKLLGKIKSFVIASGVDATIINKDLIAELKSLTSTEETSTAFFAYHFQGADKNSMLYIFYGIATMVVRKDVDHVTVDEPIYDGTRVAEANQTIEASFSKYQLKSDLVTRMADELAITVVPAQKMIEAINTRFLPP